MLTLNYPYVAIGSPLETTLCRRQELLRHRTLWQSPRCGLLMCQLHSWSDPKTKSTASIISHPAYLSRPHRPCVFHYSARSAPLSILNHTGIVQLHIPHSQRKNSPHPVHIYQPAQPPWFISLSEESNLSQTREQTSEPP